jgi:hypothetical protein
VMTIVGGVPAAFDYSSELDSFEGNIIWSAHRQFDLFAGLRAVKLDENMLTDIAGGAVTYGVDTSNELLGPQIGAAGRFGSTQGFFLHGDVRLAWLFNDRDVDFTTSGTGVALGSGGVSDETDSLLFEIGARAGYDFGQGEVFAGYRFISIENVALAPGNFDAVSIVTGVGAVEDSDVSYHAFSAGMRWTF